MPLLKSFLPEPEIFLELEPEERAPYFLGFLNASQDQDKRDMFNRNNESSLHAVQTYSSELQEKLRNALVETWEWLAREGFLSSAPGSADGWFRITEKGRKQKNPEDWESHKNARLLPRQLLHPRISQQVWSNFLRGKYDTAVFEAFKEVEIAVREAGKLALNSHGVSLMAEAFKPQLGPLTDKSLDKDRQEAIRNLFTGAIGAYRNPSVHHHAIIDPVLAAELIILANHLFKIVESRKSCP